MNTFSSTSPRAIQKTEEYKKLQPFGKVPVLEDDGLLLYESRAICKYLARFVFQQYVSNSRDGGTTKVQPLETFLFADLFCLENTLLGRN
jgi:hypothetical protein